MGFKFAHICDLLSRLEANRILKASTAAKSRNPDVSTVINWFKQHERLIHDGKTDRLALLSCLFPERRPERVFGLKEPSLAKIIGRCLLLGTSRRKELEQWKINGGADLGQCVENVMRQAENDLNGDTGITIEEIDAALGHVASKCRFSGSEIRRQRSAVSVDDTLSPIFRRLSSRDAKWFTRLILRDYSPVELPVLLILRNFHFLLPDLLLFQDSFQAALEILDKHPIKQFPPRPDAQYAKILSKLTASHVSPRVGIKIGRPQFYKGRSIKHCCKMIGKRKMSLEKKYDGEYCQIHIDLSNLRNCIQIFSKSGKDSTIDREGIHTAIKESLRIGKDNCPFTRRCILEGELLVWSDAKAKILGFHILRNHVTRSSSFIGTKVDSRPNPNEHLYIMFFDILLIDDDVCLSKSYRERRTILNKTVNLIDGRAGIAEQKYIDFAVINSDEALRESFAMAVAQRWEGLVLKAAEEPYFTLSQQGAGEYHGRWIKLKKDYIPGLGDTADFTIVGARYNSREASGLREIKNLSWTSFFVGCLESENTASFHGANRPVYRVVDVINRGSLHPQLIQTLNQLGQFRCSAFDPETSPFQIRQDQIQHPQMDVIFKTPFVVEMMGSGFEKPQNASYYVLRFPRVLKIHSDRGIEEAITFERLQEISKEAIFQPTHELSQEVSRWTEKLTFADGKPEYIVEPSEDSLSSNLSSQPITFLADEVGFKLSEPCVIENKPPSVSSPSCNSKPITSVSGSSEKRRYHPDKHDIIESISQRHRKRARSKSPCIVILSDDTKTATTTNGNNVLSQNDQSDRPLTGLTNISASKNFTSNTSESARTEMETSFNSPMVDSSPSSPGFSNDTTSPSKSQHKPAEGLHPEKIGNNHRRSTPKDLCSRDFLQSSGIRQPLPLLTTLPILLGYGVLTIIQSHTKHLSSACLTISPFLHNVLRFKPNATPSKCHAGIVLVNADTCEAENAANDITNVGNALGTLQKAGKLPGTGYILFLHWEIVRHHIDGASKCDSMREWWERFGREMFVGCLRWGVGSSRKRKSKAQERLDTGADYGHTRCFREKGHITETSAGRAVVDVCISWAWREVLSLL